MFDLVQTFYWLALSTWFGGLLFLLVAVPLIFRTLNEHKPLLPTVLSVNLENQHASLLGGSIVAAVFGAFRRLSLVCAIVLAVTLVAQWVMLKPSDSKLLPATIRAGLFVAATGLLVYDWLVIWPKIWRYLQEYLDHADEPEVANPALDLFNRYQAENLSLMRVMIVLLLGLVLYSASISPPNAPRGSEVTQKP